MGRKEVESFEGTSEAILDDANILQFPLLTEIDSTLDTAVSS